jgi:hypothetical protein
VDHSEPNDAWTTLPGWPGRTHLHDLPGGARHPLTPADIRARYALECGVTGIAVWSNATTQLAGFKGGATEHVWRMGEPHVVRLTAVRPCKGSGYICLDVVTTQASMRVASQDPFDDTDRGWFSTFAQAIASHLRAKVEEIDGGVDT